MDSFKDELKKIACTVCLTTVLSFILFFSVKIDFIQYLGIFVPLILFLLIKYFHKENVYFGGYVSLIALVNLSVFLLKKYLENYWICFDYIDFLFIAYALFDFIILRLFLISLFLKYVWPNSLENDEKLFSERKYEFDRIKDMILKYNIVGINAQWGDGKTFLFKRLERKLKNEYCFLTIKVLSVTIDSVEKFILNEINYLLEKESIFSITSTKIREVLKQPILHNVGNVFMSASSFTKSFEQIKQDVHKIGKPLVISFEDIDRIENKEILFKIFSIVDMLACGDIKFVYQYEENKLLKILEKDKLYLEKYIPYVTSLASIPFNKIIPFFCDDKIYSNLTKEDFYFFSFEMDYTISLPEEIIRRIKIDRVDKLEIPVFSIRKIQIFLDEINSSVNNRSFRFLKNTKQSVIMFYFIKHFCPFLYKKLGISKDFLDTEFFELDGEMFSLKKIINREPFPENIWNNSQNKNVLKILILLGYDFRPLLKRSEINQHVNRKRKNVEFNENVDERENNEKINRMIKNLYAAGASEYTDFENFVNEMDDEVLNRQDCERGERFRQLYQKMYYNKIDRDNATIFGFRQGTMEYIFEAYGLYEDNPNNWNNLVDFYFEYKGISEITSDLIGILNYCSLSYKSTYLHILSKFNNLKIVGHLKEEKCYLKFLDKYLSAISMLRYIDTREVEWLEAAPDEWDVIQKKVFEELKTKLIDFSSESPIDAIKEEVKLMISFIDKNFEIINFPKKLEKVVEKKSPDHDSSDQDEKIRDLEEKKLSLDEIKKELDFGYEKGVYNPYEVNDIWDYFVNKNKKTN